jgi:HlyD family secretion protein
MLLRTVFLLAAAAAAVGALVWTFWPQPILIELAAVERGQLRVTVDEDGKTRLKERYVVSAPISGRLLRVDLDAGDAICSGTTTLATLEPSKPDILDARALAQAEAKVEAAEAALDRADPLLKRALVEMDYAESELGRARKLAESQAVAGGELERAEMLYRARAQDYDSAEFAKDIARFELDMARAALVSASESGEGNNSGDRHLDIVSPIDGQVLRVFEESATVVRAGQPLLELGDPVDIEVEVDVLSTDAVKIRPGAKALLEQWGGERALEATVRLVEPSAFTKISALGVEEQRVNVILDLDSQLHARHALGDGFRVEARIVIWERDDVLRVPTGALFRQDDDWAVFLVHDDQALLRPVLIGHRNSLYAEVLEGLEEGDRVILHPSDQVQDGIHVQVRDTSTR